MFIVSLNIEGGCREGALDYIKALANNKDISVICLQEVRHALDSETPLLLSPRDQGEAKINPVRLHLFREISELLGSGWTGTFAPQLRSYVHGREAAKYDVAFGQATFVRVSDKLSILTTSSVSVYRGYNQPNDEAFGGAPSSKSMVVTTLQVEGQIITVGNVHGFWSIYGKRDMPERITQNNLIGEGLLAQIQRHNIPLHRCYTLLVGDLNYHSQMGALYHLCMKPVFGPEGGVNLNAVFGISDTRTRFYPESKPHRESDYAIASSALAPHVINVLVDQGVPSDHAALFVKIVI